MAEVDLEQERSRSEVADYLREFADELDAGSDGSRSNGSDDPDDPDGAGGSIDSGGSADPSRSSFDPVETTGTTTADADTGAGSEREGPGTLYREADDGRMTIVIDNESATSNPPERLRVGASVDTTASLLGTGDERSATFTVRLVDRTFRGGRGDGGQLGTVASARTDGPLERASSRRGGPEPKSGKGGGTPDQQEQ
jgi:hypothetical protein